MRLLPSACIFFFLLFLVNPLPSLIAKGPLRDWRVGWGDPFIPQNVSVASSSLPPSPRKLRSLGTRLGPRVQVTVWCFINHYGEVGLQLVQGPLCGVGGQAGGTWGGGGMSKEEF